MFIESIEEHFRLPNPLSQAEIAELRKLTMHEIISQLGIKKWQVPGLLLAGRKLVAAKYDTVQIFDGIPQVFDDLIAVGYDLYILSTNSNSVIDDFLARNKLTDNFRDIYAKTSIGGKHERLKKLVEKDTLTVDNCVYVGDEIRDIEAAHKMGMRCVAVTWGYNTEAALKNAEPDGIATSPRQLVDVIRTI